MILNIQGRNRKGSIYVYAAGNGGLNDNCNADGYIRSVYTIPITSIGFDGKAASYAEVCAPAFAAIYSGTFNRNLVIRNERFFQASVFVNATTVILQF